MHEFMVQIHFFFLPKALQYTLESERMKIKQPMCLVSERNAYNFIVGKTLSTESACKSQAI